MIILDFPYVSDYMQECLIKAKLPVIKTKAALDLNLRSGISWVTEEKAVSAFRDAPSGPLYTNSENSISWIAENLAFTEIPEKINLFKDKVKFRELTKPLYPDFFFDDLTLDDIINSDKEKFNYPLILKPAVGFFSLGVFKLNCPDDWAGAIEKIRADINNGENTYPREVYNSSRFILEECVPGREFAIDAYFDENGEAAILNITEHYFSSDADLSDRLYQFKPALFEEFRPSFLSELQAIGELADLKNFPVHVELRLTTDNKIIPIEVNPLRFGGWCTTADLASMSFGFNPFELFLQQGKPDWESILASKNGRASNLILLDNSTGLDPGQIKGFDYDKLRSRFKNVLEIRKVDYKKYPIFGFLFVETTNDEEDILKELLVSDLREYVIE